MQEDPPRREKESRILDMADPGGKAVEAPLFADDLWRQIDRWMNEGGAVGDGSEPSAPERTGAIANQKRHAAAASPRLHES